MRNIFDIVGKLSKEEKRYFKLHLNRTQKSEGDKKVMHLFDLVNEKTLITDAAIKQKLYPEQSKNNFYQLKNRLLDDLEKSLFSQHINRSGKTKSLYQIGVAKIYMNRLLYKEAMAILKKVERRALKKGFYDLLLLTYQEIIAIAMVYESLDLKEYLDKQLHALKKYQELLQIEQILKHVAYRLYQSNYSFNDQELESTLEEVQQKLSVHEDLIQSPKMQFEIHNCIKKLLLQKQNFKELEVFLIKSLEDFEIKQLYNKNTHDHKIINLVWLINSLFKNLKFEEAATYIQKLETALNNYNKMFYPKYQWTYYQCVFTQYFYSNQSGKAIKLLEMLTQEKRPKGLPFYDLFIRLNLAIIYFCIKDLDKAMQQLSLLLTKDIFNKLSKDLQLRLVIVEIIFHFENGDMNFLDYKITETRKLFRKLLKQETYKQVNDFLKLIKKMLSKARPFKDENTVKAIQQYIEASPKFEAGSNEAINYQLWLQTKLNKKDYYTTLLKTIQT